MWPHCGEDMDRIDRWIVKKSCGRRPLGCLQAIIDSVACLLLIGCVHWTRACKWAAWYIKGAASLVQARNT